LRSANSIRPLASQDFLDRRKKLTAAQSSRNLDLVEFRNLELGRGTAGQDRELVHGKLMLVIPAGNEAVTGMTQS